MLRGAFPLVYTHSQTSISFFLYLFCVYIYVVICLFHAANKFSTMLLYLIIQLTGLWISDKRKFQKEFWQLPSYSICCLYLACIYYMHSKKYIYFPLILIHNNLISTRKSIVPFHIWNNSSTYTFERWIIIELNLSWFGWLARIGNAFITRSRVDGLKFDAAK